MNIETIRELQKKNGFDQIQEWIEAGTAWHLEGSVGRHAMECITEGICFLPEQSHIDYWGNKVPNRNALKPGTKGTLELSIEYWTKFQEEN
jgi:hypothetical protein